MTNKEKHQQYTIIRDENTSATSDQVDETTSRKHSWSIDTCAIVGDSIVTDTDERRLVKARNFSGPTIANLRHHTILIIRKKPKHFGGFSHPSPHAIRDVASPVSENNSNSYTSSIQVLGGKISDEPFKYPS